MRSLTLLLVVLAFAGCKKEPAPISENAPPATDGTPGSADATDKTEPTAKNADAPKIWQPHAAKPGAKPELKLVRAGKKPRRAHRWAPAPQQQKLTLFIDNEFQARLVTIQTHQAPRSVTVELTVAQGTTPAQGVRSVDFTIDKISTKHGPDVPPKAREARDTAADLMRGAQGSYVVGDAGVVEQLTMKLPPSPTREVWGLAGDLEWALRQLTVPFAEKPVGRGARWTVRRGVIEGGVQATETSTHEIAALKDPTVTVKVRATQTAEPQTFRNPGSQTDMQLSKHSSETDGEMTWNPAQLVPVAAEAITTTNKEMTYQFEGQAVETSMLTKRTLRIGQAP